MLDMAKQEILPACLKYTKFVVDNVAAKKSIGIEAANETSLAQRLNSLTEDLMTKIDALDAVVKATPSVDDDPYVCGNYYVSDVIPAMDSLRATADTLETIVSKEYWPFPTYTDLLYLV